MENSTPNPYESSRVDRDPNENVLNAHLSVACIVWTVISIAIWFGQLQMAPIYADFGVELPSLTRTLMHPAFPLLPMATAGFVAIAAPFLSRPQRHRLCLASNIVAISSALLATYLLFVPVVILLNSLR
ncbi:hypothetical protein [Posidoniimonas polymericola]|uniref:hypothetical protein n=1 Tax=Posidoniimonas polymericola TaxID=2528002 RepID=UPI0018D32CDC|nr:hypothetical protein [Posidoniimonas polymericola]